MRSLNIQREPGWIGGVASGIATRLGIDPLIVRGIIVVVAILGGPALLVYAAAWLLLPDLDDKIHLERVLKGEFEPPVAGIGVLVLLALLPVSQGFWFAGSAFWGEPYWGAAIGRALWTLVILGLAIWLVVAIARRPGIIPTIKANMTSSPPPPPANAPAAEFTAWREQQAAWKAENIAYRQQQNAERAAAYRTLHDEQRAAFNAHAAVVRERARRSRPNPLFSILVIGLALVAGGVTVLTLKGGELEVTTIVAGLSVALAVLALGMITNGARGKRAGGAAGIAWLVVIPLIIFAGFPQNDHFQYANTADFTPRDVARTQSDIYVAGGGHVFMNLEDYYAGGTWTAASGASTDDVYLFVAVGDVVIDLPAEGYSAVDANALIGDVRVRGDDGLEPQDRSPLLEFGDDTDDEHHVTLHVFVFSGDITINDPESN
jgi:phage shock protein PspC (stress-responsive transcriptional regulator)